jgi:hypothetical protein|tara:strand:+ start:331 stop:504 length:174 start_codon:yes stop_codon:yes gene_type:complete
MSIVSQAVLDDLNIGFSLPFESLLTQYKTGYKYYFLYNHQDSEHRKNPQVKGLGFLN